MSVVILNGSNADFDVSKRQWFYIVVLSLYFLVKSWSLKLTVYIKQQTGTLNIAEV